MHSLTAISATVIRLPRGTLVVATIAMILTTIGTGTIGTTGGAGCGRETE